MTKGQRHKEESIDKIKKARVSQIITEKTCRKISKANKKVKHTKEWNEKVRQSKIGKKRPDIAKEKNPNWRGGTSSLRDKYKETIEYRLWMELLFVKNAISCFTRSLVMGIIQKNN